MVKYEDGEKAKTYGVGPSAEKKNVGQDINAFSRQDDEGRVYERGEVVFDPNGEGGEYEIEQEDNAEQSDESRVDDGTKETQGKK